MLTDQRLGGIKKGEVSAPLKGIPHYHRPSDTMEKLDYRFMAELVQSLALFFCAQ